MPWVPYACYGEICSCLWSLIHAIVIISCIQYSPNAHRKSFDLVLLQVKDFLLRPMRDMPGQRTLFDHKAHAAHQVAPAELYPALAQQQQQPSPPQQQQEQQLLPQQEQQEQQEQPQQPLQPQPQQQSLPPLPLQQRQLGRPGSGTAVAAGSTGKARSLYDSAAVMSPDHGLAHEPAAAAAAGAAGAAVAGGAGAAVAAQQGGKGAGPAAAAAAAAGVRSPGDVRAHQVAAALRAQCDMLKGPPKTTADDPQGFVGSFFRWAGFCGLLVGLDRVLWAASSGGQDFVGSFFRWAGFCGLLVGLDRVLWAAFSGGQG
jgi:hypothetical protein